MPPIPRSNDFAVIATGNIYPNEAPPPEYRANNQQDLSLLDRFSGSVYKVMPSKLLDEQFCRFQFLYDMLVGNYYEYMDAIKNKTTKPQAKGLRTILKDLGLDELAVVSYRTLTAFRVSFEFQLVRKIAESEGNKILNEGKTLDKAFDSFMIAFNNDATQANIIKNTGLTTAFIQKEVSGCIKKVIDGKIVQTLTSVVAANASTQLEKYKQLFVADYYQVNA
jgi:cobaltochelatase CobS